MTFVVPMIAYEDGNAAMDWLIEAFGFVEADRRISADGRLTHGELEAGGAIVMLAEPTPDYQSPKHHAEVCEQARKWRETPFVVDGVHVSVDDIDAHYARAQAAGATILSRLEDNTGIGQRQYRAEDLEGHRWMFATSL